MKYLILYIILVFTVATNSLLSQTSTGTIVLKNGKTYPNAKVFHEGEFVYVNLECEKKIIFKQSEVQELLVNSIRWKSKEECNPKAECLSRGEEFSWVEGKCLNLKDDCIDKGKDWTWTGKECKNASKECKEKGSNFEWNGISCQDGVPDNFILWEGEKEYKPEYTPGFFNKFGFGLWSKNTTINKESNPKFLQLNLFYGETKDVHGLNFGLGMTYYTNGYYKSNDIRNSNMNGVSINGFLGFYRNVNGISLSGIASVAENVTGISIGTVNLAKKLNGIQIGGFNYLPEDNKRTHSETISKGLQVGFMNGATKGTLVGGQIGGQNFTREINGVQAGLLNASEDTNGLQLGILNFGDKLIGIQIGIINSASIHKGLQIGLLNKDTNGFLPFFPFINLAYAGYFFGYK